MSKLLEIRNLHSHINHQPVLNGVSLSVYPGEIHAIMGKNGSGKSTLSKVIAGHPSYIVQSGQIYLDNEEITNIMPEERSHKGIFLAFQYPVEIPGVNNIDFLRRSYNAKQKAHNKNEIDPLAFYDLIHTKMKNIDMDANFLNRNVNEGFSGGEKKKNEILQMSLLNSKVAILDETDSGLDIDALKTISNTINNSINEKKAIILITHYQRLLKYIVPDYVHIMDHGQIVHTGNARLAEQLEKYGYEYISR
uniref:Probable ATP-dependent transporter ycf16 n=1 Tax=Callithamnion tetricum TaxID=193179 RepID=A0A4D6WTS5_9FLOR|nr:iron-sulfur cluster formation ABC transporter ATP-binding subunit [Callithamnion tetricum]